MHFKLSLSLLTATTWLASAQNGPFTMTWFTDRNCRARGLNCYRYTSYECCERPPGASSFKSVRATSSGPFGIVVFTEVTNAGGCGLCATTGSINTCYLNEPFRTLFVAQLSQCQPHMRSSDQHSTARIPVVEQHAECNKTVPINTATINGHDYDVTGPESERMQIMADVLDLTDEEFAAKWASKYRGPSTDLDLDGTPTTLETVSINTATINGHDYDVTGPESERMQIMADVLDLTDEEFAAKWASKYRGPATDLDGTPTTLATTLATTLVTAITPTSAKSA